MIAAALAIIAKLEAELRTARRQIESLRQENRQIRREVAAVA
jgi:hypothetical protein